jgi:protein-S-isoprenylcysteine O-methyltransferase Ste14
MRDLSFPVSAVQVWLFMALSIVFLVYLVRAFVRRTGGEAGAKTDGRSRLGVIIQSIAIGLASFGPPIATLAPFSIAGIAGTLAVLGLMGGSIGLFAASSGALGRNWSIVARTRSDHQLVRHGPYARVRHPIYLGLLLFMIALAVALGHYWSLIAAVPIYLVGTVIRTKVEDQLLEASFGDAFRDYARTTPALIPKLF